MFGWSGLERKGQPLAPPAVFARRVWRNARAAALIAGFSLALGAAGYHYLGGLPWLDGLLNAAMILTGMGPVDPMRTAAGKLFATFYALYSGIAFLTMMAVLMAPLYHRFIHDFHLQSEAGEDREDEAAGEPGKR